MKYGPNRTNFPLEIVNEDSSITESSPKPFGLCDLRFCYDPFIMKYQGPGFSFLLIYLVIMHNA